MSTIQLRLLRSSAALTACTFYTAKARMHNAKLYATANKMQLRDVKQILENPNYCINWPNKGAVLDVGCGPGDVTSGLLRRFVPNDVTIVGSDVSKDMIDYANATHKDDRTCFKCLDIQSSNIWDEWECNSFDVIVSFYCIHWLQEQQTAANNIYGLLKPSGEFLALFLGKGSPFYKLYEHLSSDDRWTFLFKNSKQIVSPFQSSSDPSQYYSDILAEAKFQNIQVEQKTTSYSFPSKKIILDSILAVDPLFKQVPEDKVEDYKKTIMDIVLKCGLACETEDGSVKVTYSIMMAKACKQ